MDSRSIFEWQVRETLSTPDCRVRHEHGYGKMMALKSIGGRTYVADYQEVGPYDYFVTSVRIRDCDVDVDHDEG